MARTKPTPPPEQQEVLSADNTGQPPFPEPGGMTDTKIPEAGMSIEEGLAKQAPAQQQIVNLLDIQIGDRVTHHSRGDGTVTQRNDISGWVRWDRTPADEPTIFDLRTPGAILVLTVPSKVTKAPEQATAAPSGVPAAAIPLTTEEIDRLHTEAMFAHAAKGQLLAAHARGLKDTQTKDQAALNEVHKALKEAQEAVVAHAENAPRRDQFQQKTIEFTPATGVSSTAPTKPPDQLGYAVRPDQVMSLKDSGLTLRDLHDALFPEFKPGKKAKDVGKMGVEIKASGYLIREHSSDQTRWFAQLMVDQGIWAEKYEADYGQPITSFDTTAEARQDRTKGGPDCGKLVKVGKKTAILAPESDGLVIVATKEEVEKYISWQKASELPDSDHEDDIGK